MELIFSEISPGCSLEGMMLKLKLQHFGHLMWRVDSLEKTLMLGGIGGRRRRGRQRMKWMDGITDSMDMSFGELITGSSWWTGRPGVLQFMGSQRVGHDWETELNWTDAFIYFSIHLSFYLHTSSLPVSSPKLSCLSRCHSHALSLIFSHSSFNFYTF